MDKITVTARISNVIYHIEMDKKESYSEIIQEINSQFDAENLTIKILKIKHQTSH